MRIAICSGSYDPITLGHVDIITRSSKLFDKVVALLLVNPLKSPSFSVEERVELIRASVSHLPNVEVDTHSGLLVDYAKKTGAGTIIRGLRAVTDFEYEFQMALINKKLCPEVETLYLNTSAEYLYLSSSIVKQVANFGGDISPFVPAAILDQVDRKLNPNRN